MGQYNLLLLIGAYLVYIIVLCIRKKIGILSTFFTLAFGAGIYFTFTLSRYDGTNLEGLFDVITLAMLFSLLITIIFVRSLYVKKPKKQKNKKVKQPKEKKVKEENKVETKIEEPVKKEKTKKESKPKKEKKQKEETTVEVEIEEKIEEVPVVTPKKQEHQFEEIPLEEKVDENLNQDNKEVSLKESIQLAKKNTGGLVINKKTVYDYLKKYSDVELNTRKNITSTGLPLADTHYRLVQDNKICFIYVYEIEGKSFMIIRLANKEKASNYIKKYNLKKSAFPKQPFDWYTVIISNKFKTNDEVFELIDEAYNQVN